MNSVTFPIIKLSNGEYWIPIIVKPVKILDMLLLVSHIVHRSVISGLFTCRTISPDLRYLQIVDDPTIMPYKIKEIIWDGLGLINFAFLPHYKSDHPESKDIDKEVEYCKKNKIPT